VNISGEEKQISCRQVLRDSNILPIANVCIIETMCCIEVSIKLKAEAQSYTPCK
jgi:hypothetical protein